MIHFGEFYLGTIMRTFSTGKLFQNQIDVLKPLQCKMKWISTVDSVALSNGLHGSIFTDWVAPSPCNTHKT